MNNPYKILGINKNANKNEIKKAYRALAKQTHPDKNPANPEAEEKFKEISAAYEVLNDSKKKAEYDQFGNVGGQNNYKRYSGGFGDIFSNFGFNFGGQQRRTTKGQNLNQQITISFIDAVKGTNKEILTEYSKTCSKCKGSGAESNKDIVTCNSCKGSGQISSTIGALHYITECGTCNGEGHVITKKCSKCSGKGLVYKKEKLKISIPAGVDSGTVIRLKGKGSPGPVEPGDLYLHTIVSIFNLDPNIAFI